MWRYDPETGHVTWAKKTGKKVIVGARVGAPHCAGYLQTNQKGEVHLLHRLVWLYVHGDWPPEQIDHINGNRADNRLCNLRLATNSQNTMNQGRRKTNRSGYRGVYWVTSRKKWVARITKDGVHTYLGQFASLEQAAEAYRSAAVEQFGAFVHHEVENRDA